MYIHEKYHYVRTDYFPYLSILPAPQSLQSHDLQINGKDTPLKQRATVGNRNGLVLPLLSFTYKYLTVPNPSMMFRKPASSLVSTLLNHVFCLAYVDAHSPAHSHYT